MFETFSRSWEITKKSFSVIKSDKEILAFPLLASFFSVLFFLAMAIPFLLTDILRDQLQGYGDFLIYVLVFIFYLGTSFIATFFNVSVVYCAKKRFEGKDPSFMEGLKEAFKRIHLIFLWSIVSATVGLILRILEDSVRRSKQSDLAKMFFNLIIGLLGAAWSVVSIFVVPAIVFDNVGPFQALKNSVHAIKKTWGESLIRHYGLGLAEFVFVLLGLLILIPGIFLLGVVWQLGVALILLFVVYEVVVFLVFSAANTIFNTALYMYAKGHHVKLFGEETLKHAFVNEK
ncbi:MAG: DUF6159 family protein [Candidatus Woesearchaeota archaeon]